MTEATGPKQEYASPKLVRYGTLSELTQAGRTHFGGDFIIYDDEGHRGSQLTPNPPGDRGPGA